VPEQLTKFLGDLRQIIAGLLAFLTPRQKRLIFIGLPVFGALAYAGQFIFEQMNYGPLYTNRKTVNLAWNNLPPNPTSV